MNPVFCTKLVYPVRIEELIFEKKKKKIEEEKNGRSLKNLFRKRQ